MAHIQAKTDTHQKQSWAGGKEATTLCNIIIVYNIVCYFINFKGMI